jgi:hypothetical protein
MGDAIEVDAYVRRSTGAADSAEGYEYVPVYRGQSLTVGLYRALRARLAGSGCVRIVWRGP